MQPICVYLLLIIYLSCKGDVGNQLVIRFQITEKEGIHLVL